MEQTINIQQAFFNSFLKNQAFKKKIINISYFIMVLIKTRLLIFSVLIRYGLACKYGIISQMSIYNWIQNCISWYFWCCIFIFLRSNYNLLQQVRWFDTWWVESIIISSDSNLTQNIIRETIKVEKKTGILTRSGFNGTLRTWLIILGNS